MGVVAVAVVVPLVSNTLTQLISVRDHSKHDRLNNEKQAQQLHGSDNNNVHRSL